MARSMSSKPGSARDSLCDLKQMTQSLWASVPYLWNGHTIMITLPTCTERFGEGRCSLQLFLALYLAMSGNLLGCGNWGRNVTGISWVKARDAAEHSPMPGTASTSTNYAARTVNSAGIEEKEPPRCLSREGWMYKLQYTRPVKQ